MRRIRGGISRTNASSGRRGRRRSRAAEEPVGAWVAMPSIHLQVFSWCGMALRSMLGENVDPSSRDVATNGVDDRSTHPLGTRQPFKFGGWMWAILPAPGLFHRGGSDGIAPSRVVLCTRAGGGVVGGRCHRRAERGGTNRFSLVFVDPSGFCRAASRQHPVGGEDGYERGLRRGSCEHRGDSTEPLIPGLAAGLVPRRVGRRAGGQAR